MFRKRLTRFASAAVAFAVSATLAQAHFVFVMPSADAKSATVVMNEELVPTSEVPIQTIGGLKLNAIDTAGHDAAVTPVIAGGGMTVDLSAAPARVVYGSVDLGVVKHGPSKPNWLTYFPKAIVGDPFDVKANLGDRTPVELVPVGRPGDWRLKLLAGGKPVAGGQVMVVPQHGDQAALDTDANGLTPPIEGAGRYGFWARNVTVTPGEKGGKAYAEIRKYATLVIDVPAASAATTMPATAPAAALLPVEKFNAMPQAASSFGAVAAGGFVYVYGGHIADTHNYSTKSVSGQFHRLALAGDKPWEKLPDGRNLQGMNLAAHDGKIIRVGGMSPVNADGEADDVRSVADVAAYEPAAGKWADLPPLPTPRSSHDVVVLNDKLYVFGGWTLTGTPGDAQWPDAGLVLDLKAADPQWQPVPQPFKRRALIAATTGGKIYVMGGFDSEDEPSLKVDIFDPATQTWTAGPELPKPALNGFGPAAVAIDGTLYASVGDGSLLKFDGDAKAWTKIATATPRIVHRLVADGQKLLILGGAKGRKQTDLIERVDVGATVAARD